MALDQDIQAEDLVRLFQSPHLTANQKLAAAYVAAVGMAGAEQIANVLTPATRSAWPWIDTCRSYVIRPLLEKGILRRVGENYAAQLWEVK